MGVASCSVSVPWFLGLKSHQPAKRSQPLLATIPAPNKPPTDGKRKAKVVGVGLTLCARLAQQPVVQMEGEVEATYRIESQLLPASCGCLRRQGKMGWGGKKLTE